MIDTSKIFESIQGTGQKEAILESSGFNIDQLNELIDLQKQFNSEVVGNDWQNKDLNFSLAILIEAVELVDSTDWKWWKKGEVDWNNILTELVDIFHFLISKLIITKSDQMLIPLFIGFENANHKKVTSSDIIELINTEFIINYATQNFIGVFIVWSKIWYGMELNFIDLYKQYKIKFILNQFRQKNGYKEGTYKKLWNGKEDNIICKQLANEINVEELETVLFDKLQSYYDKITPSMPSEKNIQTFLQENNKWGSFFLGLPKESQVVIYSIMNEYHNYRK
ncbi:MAG: dUTP diphosphatase [Sphaerochaeta sp.]|jgi:dimeric dUTPase (all-alpha-NTP-PPase superfamily)